MSQQYHQNCYLVQCPFCHVNLSIPPPPAHMPEGQQQRVACSRCGQQIVVVRNTEAESVVPNAPPLDSPNAANMNEPLLYPNPPEEAVHAVQGVAEIHEVVEANPYAIEPTSALISYNSWAGETLSCCDSPGSICYGVCCTMCMYCEVGCDAYDHGGETGCDFCIQLPFVGCASTFCFPCTLICCPQYMIWCWQGHLLGRFRNKYNLPKLQFGESNNNCCRRRQKSPNFFQ